MFMYLYTEIHEYYRFTHTCMILYSYMVVPECLEIPENITLIHVYRVYPIVLHVYSKNKAILFLVLFTRISSIIRRQIFKSSTVELWNDNGNNFGRNNNRREQPRLVRLN